MEQARRVAFLGVLVIGVVVGVGQRWLPRWGKL